MDYSAQEEDVTLAPAALEILTKIGSETSLRKILFFRFCSSSYTHSILFHATGYVIQLVTLANLVARRRKSPAVEVADVRRVYTLFLDEKRSVQYLKEYGSLFVGEDGTTGVADNAMETL